MARIDSCEVEKRHQGAALRGDELTILLSDMNLCATKEELDTVENYHKRGKSCKYISEKLKRDPDEIAVIKMDLARKGVIK